MKSRYAISIPKPCHENWSEMTQNEKGRFCQSCSKTVVDFTKMNTNNIQVFIHNNKDQRICGHIRQNQLDAINIQIDDTIFKQKLSFHKLFLLALLLAMGTSLLSCSDETGQTQKIHSVEIIEKVIDTTQIEVKTHIDSIVTISATIEKVKDSQPPEIITTGDIVVLDGIMIVEELDPNKPMSWHQCDEKPSFINTPNHFSKKEAKDYFNKQMNDFVLDNFEIIQGGLSLKGKQRIHSQFIIDKHGNIKDIQVRAPYIWLEKETKRVINLLPQFIPAKHKGKTVDITYNLPIIFNIED